MISTFLTAAAFYQTAAVRPERAGAGSAATMGLSKVGDLLEPARVLASSMNTLETSQAIKAASGIVDKILLQQGNATKHMEAEDKTLLQQVVDLMTTTVYGSMDSSHTADEGSLSASIADIEKCNTDIANRQSATGDLGRMHRGVKNKQEELNSLQLVVDAKTAANNSAWEVLAIHMSLIANPPAVPAFPARTMGALNVYFEHSKRPSLRSGISGSLLTKLWRTQSLHTTLRRPSAMSSSAIGRPSWRRAAQHSKNATVRR